MRILRIEVVGLEFILKCRRLFATDWATARTENGETCLHLTGINGATEVTKLLLERGADPNVRSTFEEVRGLKVRVSLELQYLSSYLTHMDSHFWFCRV
jgi:ankyrin repeat protein